MRALTLKQPWAWAIFHAGKDIENRTWNTSIRGRVAIHAGQSLDLYASMPSGIIVPKDLIYGAILGTVEIIDVVESSDSPWYQGFYGFVLKDPVLFDEPVTCKGWLGFWNIDPDLLKSQNG